VKDGTTIYYKDWGKGPVITLSHGWPLNSDMWDGQMLGTADGGGAAAAIDEPTGTTRRRSHDRPALTDISIRTRGLLAPCEAATAASASGRAHLVNGDDGAARALRPEVANAGAIQVTDVRPSREVKRSSTS
jgi:non-heme chloroperoxidase